ncbi:hypothetical protein [Pseudomonas cannabina]|uniref:hypothetical protein n=1 Tax=Pseudomonas cannabina TaxID=86840 RepID=UPI00111339B9|nr:hypothetical protein [Pseudomonas cannabina]
MRPKSGKGTEKSLSIHFSAWVMGEKSFLPTSTPRWHHAEGTFFGGLPCIGIIEIPIHQADQLRKTHAFIEGKERLTMHIII